MAYWKEHPYKMTRKGQGSRYTGRADVKLDAKKTRRQLDKIESTTPICSQCGNILSNTIDYLCAVCIFTLEWADIIGNDEY